MWSKSLISLSLPVFILLVMHNAAVGWAPCRLARVGMAQQTKSPMARYNPTSTNAMNDGRSEEMDADCGELESQILHGTLFTTCNRRQSLLCLLSCVSGAATSMTLFRPEISQASEVRAPLELLRPATRIRIYINEAIRLCQGAKMAIQNSDDPSAVGIKQLERLQDYFDHEPTFMTAEEQRLSQRYMQIDTNTAWQKARLKEREARGAELGIDYTTPYDRFNTAIQQFGDKTQFKILRDRQRNLEQSNAMRAAFNAYTNNLVFGDAYQLNVQGDAKKAMVRNDALPDVNAVVVSDLDLRDLYRNQILQNMDDTKAEIAYQLKSGEVDMDEVLSYLRQAQMSCDEWFSFIPRADVEEAYRTVSSAL